MKSSTREIILQNTLHSSQNKIERYLQSLIKSGEIWEFDFRVKKNGLATIRIKEYERDEFETLTIMVG